MPAKILILSMILLPFVLLMGVFHDRMDKDSVGELGFWLGVSLLGMAGVCFVGYTDPRIYRYLIAIWSFSSVFMVVFVFQNSFGLKKEFILGVGGIIFFIVFFGGSYVSKKVVPCSIPTVEENVGVLFNRIHMGDVIPEYYPKNAAVLKEFHKNKQKSMKAAWDVGRGGANSLSAFLLPVRPQLGLWCTTIVKWSSYANEDLIINDLKEHKIEWVMNSESDELVFYTLEEYAEELVQENRYPEKMYYNYSFPKELSDIQW